MPQIRTYQDDDEISLNDRLLGTDAEDLEKTKNYRISNVIDFLISQGIGEGISAYQVAVNNGFEGTEEEWLESLVGSQGPTGATGPQGPTGATGATGAAGADGADGAGITYVEYAARLSQTGTSDPTEATVYIDDVNNNAGTGGASPGDADFRLVEYERTGVGTYKLKIYTSMAYPTDFSKTDVSFSDGKIRVTGSSTLGSSPFNILEFTFESRDNTGTLADGVISFTTIYIRIFN